VAAGQAEYAVSYQPTLQMLVAEGLPLVRVGVLVAQPLNSLVALEDGPVKTIADFKGRKIGFSIAGFEEALLGAILEKAGLTLKDVTLVNVNFALTTALMSKQVDGVIGAFRNFELNDLELHKAKGRLWPVETNGVPTYDELILVAKRETVDVPRTKKLLAAISEATAWLKANPAEAWSVFSKSGKDLDNELNKLAWKDTLPLLATDPTALERSRYQAFADFLVKRGLIKQAPPLDSYLRDIK
jgi:putative hydroxymethylpyrimidine transport system substrate-binding protein